MPLPGGPANTLLPISGASEPVGKGEQHGAGLGLGRTRKWEPIKPPAVHSFPGPALVTCLGAPSKAAYGETDPCWSVQICLQAGLHPWLPSPSKTVSVQC